MMLYFMCWVLGVVFFYSNAVLKPTAVRFFSQYSIGNVCYMARGKLGRYVSAFEIEKLLG